MKQSEWILTLLLAGLMMPGAMWAQEEKPARTGNEARAQALALLKKLETVSPFRCTSVTTSTHPQDRESQSPGTLTSQIWQKGPYFRSEQVGSRNGLVINRPEGVFVCQESGTCIQSPDFAKEAMLQEFKLPPNQSTGVERIWSDALDSADLKISGTEVIDGKETTVIAYTTSPFRAGRATVKLWLWNENGLALKMEKTTSLNEAVVGTQLTQWKDFVFENIPDSLFDIPHGQVQKLPEDWHP